MPTVKHDLQLTKEILETYYVFKVHATSIKLFEALKDNKYPMHWRLTVECKLRPKDQTELAKGASGSKAQTKGGRSSISKKSNSKAQGSTKTKEEQKSIFISILPVVASSDDVKRNGGKENVPTIMITRLRDSAHSDDSPIDPGLTFRLKESKKNGMSALELFKWFEKKGHLRYKKAEDGNGCAFYVKRLISDMKEDKWFDLNDNTTKESFNTLNNFKKGAIFGDCYMEYGIGTFY